MTSGVPQASVLWPLLFLYINNLISEISNYVCKFGDDSKIGRINRSQSDVKDLQGDLGRLIEWVVRWQMEFNHDKCKVMDVGNLEGKILTTGTT